MEPTSQCQACGKDVPSGRFCAHCGHPLTPPSPSPATAAPSAEVPPTDTVPIPEATGPATTVVSGTSHVDAGTDAAADQDPAIGQELDDSQPTNRPRLSNRNVGIVATTFALLAVAGYLIIGTGGESHTVTGQLALTTASDLSVGSSCEGTGGYSDIAPGTQVIIEDETGSTLATSSFGTGTFDGVSCIFGFEFTDVPKAAFYRVHQSSDRGVLQYSYQDMVDSNWSVSLTLGDLEED